MKSLKKFRVFNAVSWGRVFDSAVQWSFEEGTVCWKMTYSALKAGNKTSGVKSRYFHSLKPDSIFQKIHNKVQQKPFFLIICSEWLEFQQKKKKKKRKDRMRSYSFLGPSQQKCCRLYLVSKSHQPCPSRAGFEVLNSYSSATAGAHPWGLLPDFCSVSFAPERVFFVYVSRKNVTFFPSQSIH